MSKPRTTNVPIKPTQSAVFEVEEGGVLPIMSVESAYVPTKISGVGGNMHIPIYEIVNTRLKELVFSRFTRDDFKANSQVGKGAYHPFDVWESVYNYFEYTTTIPQIRVGYQQTSDDLGNKTAIPVYKERPFNWFALIAYTGIQKIYFDSWAVGTSMYKPQDLIMRKPVDNKLSGDGGQREMNRRVLFAFMMDMIDNIINAQLYDHALVGNFNAKIAARMLGLDKPYTVQQIDNTNTAQITGMVVT